MSNIHQKGFTVLEIVLLVVLILFIIAGAYFVGLMNTKSSLVTADKPIAAATSVIKNNESEKWDQYTIPNLRFFMEYPSSWTVKQEKVALSEVNQIITFSGLQGSVVIKMGTGFGGGCPSSIKIKLDSEEIDGCKSAENSLVFSKLTNIPILLGANSSSKMGILVEAKSNEPFSTNMPTILKILSTFNFNQSSPEAIVQDFYSNYIKCVFDSKNASACISGIKDLDPRLVSHIQQTKGVDPIVCAQDLPQIALAQKAVVNGNKASIVINEEFDSIQKINVESELINNQWKIVNIICN